MGEEPFISRLSASPDYPRALDCAEEWPVCCDGVGVTGRQPIERLGGSENGRVSNLLDWYVLCTSYIHANTSYKSKGERVGGESREAMSCERAAATPCLSICDLSLGGTVA